MEIEYINTSPTRRYTDYDLEKIYNSVPNFFVSKNIVSNKAHLAILAL